MSRLIRITIAACLILLFAISGRAAPRAQHVFIISLDGGKPAVLQQSKMPTLFAMIREGATTWDAQTVYPSVTLVAHTSMLTGLVPARHKVFWNDWEPRRGLVTVPTIFKIAKEHGFRTAMFVGKEKFRHLNVPGTLDEFSCPAYSARIVATAAARYIEAQKPNLCFIHFADSDGAGHKYGWGSDEQKKSFADEDAALRVIRQAIERARIAGTSVVIVSADHGGHARTHGTNSPEDMTIPWIAWGAGVQRGFKITAPVKTYDTAATALWLLGLSVPADWNGKPVISAFIGTASSTAAPRRLLIRDTGPQEFLRGGFSSIAGGAQENVSRIVWGIGGTQESLAGALPRDSLAERGQTFAGRRLNPLLLHRSRAPIRQALDIGKRALIPYLLQRLQDRADKIGVTVLQRTVETGALVLVEQVHIVSLEAMEEAGQRRGGEALNLRFRPLQRLRERPHRADVIVFG